MATVAGTINLTGCNYQLQYDILSQSVANNTTTIRLYGVLNVTNNYISWSSGSASVHTASTGIGTYYGRGSHTLITADFTFTHNNDGTLTIVPGYSLNTTFVSGSSTATITLPNIPRQANITSAPNFNDEDNPTIQYSNPLGNNANELKACISLTGITDDVPYRDISKTGSSYTFELTNEERDTLRNATTTSNSRKVKFFVLTKIGNNTYYSIVEKTFSIINGNPIFSDYTIADVNPTTVALTGSTTNDVINVNGYSNIQATITTNDIAEAIKKATMTKYRLAIGDSSTDITYSDEEDVSGVVNSASNGTYNLYAIDSRNNSTLVVKQATSVINYEKVAIDKQNCSFVRDNNQVGENAILTINGTFWNDNFGQANNSLSVSYRLKKTDSSTWITGTTTITPTISNNTFTFTGMIASDNQDTTWDLDSSYNLEVIVSDELSSASVELILNSAVPTMSLDKNGVGIMCAYDSSLGGNLQVDGKIIDGGTILWTNPNPTSSFSSQTITLSSGDYDILEWYIGASTSGTYLFTEKSIKNFGISSTFITELNQGYNQYTGFIQRNIKYSTDTTYNIANCLSRRNASQSTPTIDNGYMIPLYVIGYKTNLFS